MNWMQDNISAYHFAKGINIVSLWRENSYDVFMRFKLYPRLCNKIHLCLPV